MYDKPDKIINMFGYNIYAYITYINSQTLHNLPNLITLSYSLIRCGSFVDKICIITNDVSDDYVNLLERFYKIIRITDILIHNISFIKYYALSLTQYKKILLINPNFVILQNPDFLFTLRPPCGHFHGDNLIPDLLLLSPNVGDFDSMIFDMKHSLIKIDENDYIYNKYYSYHWVKIDENYFYKNQMIYNIDKVKYIYYQINPTNIILADIHQDDIYMVWFNIYKNMLESNSDFITNPLLSYTNKVLTNLIKTRGLSRNVEAIDETEIAGLKNIYESGEIHMSLAKYYHKDKDNESFIYNEDTLFEKIDNFDYMNPIKKLNDYFSNEYYSSINNYTTSEDKSLHMYNYIDINDRDNIMRLYIKSNNNISIEILNGSEEDNKLKLDEFKLNGLYYIKNIYFTKKEYENLLFILDYKISYANRINKIDNTKIEDNNNLLFCFINKKPENYIKTLEIADLILNQNNLHRLKNQDIRNLATPFFSKSNLYIETLRNWISSNLTPLEQERLLLFGDIILNSYGIKTIENIYGIFVSIDNDNTEYEKNIESTINQGLSNNSKLFFCKIVKENSKDYKIFKNIIDDIKQKAGITKLSELVSNPNYFSTYKGLKLLNIELNMLWLEHQRKNIIKTDIIMVNKINKNILSRFANFDEKSGNIILNKQKIKISDKDMINIITLAKKNYIKEYIKLI
jgi:hypothetical protein